jgi:bifunctional non-homologous end joining protein LigD
VIDLDSGEGVEWQAVIEAAPRMRDLMKAEGLEPWPKLTGGEGVHLMVPLKDRLTHDEAHRYARRLVGALAESDPELYAFGAGKPPRPNLSRLPAQWPRHHGDRHLLPARARRVSDCRPCHLAGIGAGIRPDAFTMKSPFRARCRDTTKPV